MRVLSAKRILRGDSTISKLYHKSFSVAKLKQFVLHGRNMFRHVRGKVRSNGGPSVLDDRQLT
jgi:hypothetical protein